MTKKSNQYWVEKKEYLYRIRLNDKKFTEN